MKRLIALVSYNIHSNHLNYGAALHTYAFQQYLKRHGIESVIIDYFPLALEGRSIKYPFLNFRHIGKIRDFLRHQVNYLGGFHSNLIKYHKFNGFFKCHTIKTRHRYNHQELMSVPSIEQFPIDTFVCESDVIWKLYSRKGFDDVFFLNIPAAKNKRKVAYSPSLGSRPFDLEEEKIFKEFIKDFHGISTREQQGAVYIQKLTGCDIDWVLDPTLLLDDNDYDNIITPLKNVVISYYIIAWSMIRRWFMKPRHTLKRKASSLLRLVIGISISLRTSIP